jgi:hypothetical protein
MIKAAICTRSQGAPETEAPPRPTDAQEQVFFEHAPPRPPVMAGHMPEARVVLDGDVWGK